MKPASGVTDPLRDDPLCAEIERALAVDPSPELTARVRARVAELPAPGWGVWRLRWAVAPVAVAAAAGAIAMVLLDAPRPGDVQQSDEAPASATTVAQRAPASGGAPAVESGEPSTSTPTASDVPVDGRATQEAPSAPVAARSSSELPLPEVLLPHEEIAAWQNYLAMFSQGDVDRPLPKLLRERDETPEPSDIVIPPLALSVEDPFEGEVE
jgi:hypothetical protein